MSLLSFIRRRKDAQDAFTKQRDDAIKKYVSQMNAYGSKGPTGPSGFAGGGKATNTVTGSTGPGGSGASGKALPIGIQWGESQPTDPAIGQAYFDTTTNTTQVYNGNHWVELHAPAGGDRMEIDMNDFFEQLAEKKKAPEPGLLNWDNIQSDLDNAPYMRKVAILDEIKMTILQRIKTVDDVEVAEMELTTYSEVSNNCNIPVELANLFVLLEKASQEILKG